MPLSQMLNHDKVNATTPPKLTVSSTPKFTPVSLKHHTPVSASEVEPCPWEESQELLRLQQLKKQEEEELKRNEESTEVVVQQQTDDNKKPEPQVGIFRYYMRCYYQLWKTRLSSLVVFTTMGGMCE
jgi:hypothetical protein